MHIYINSQLQAKHMQLSDSASSANEHDFQFIYLIQSIAMLIQLLMYVPAVLPSYKYIAMYA